MGSSPPPVTNMCGTRTRSSDTAMCIAQFARMSGMARPSALTQEVASTVQRMAEAGSTRAEIAAAVGVHPDSLTNWAKRGATVVDGPYRFIYSALEGQHLAPRSIRKICRECDKPFYLAAFLAERVARCDDCRAGHRAVARLCSTCEREFMAAPSSTRRRCDRCVAEGRGRCVACGNATAVEPGGQGVGLCPSCREGETSQGPLRPDYLRLTCRGATAFGETRHAKRCEWNRIMTRVAALGRLTTFDPATQTYICDRCHGLVIAVLGAPKRQRRLRRRGLLDPGERLDLGAPRSFKDVQELINREARTSSAWLPGDTARFKGHRPTTMSESAVWKRMAGKWRRDPQVVVALCRGCGRLTLNAKADVARGIGPLAFHRSCWEEACQTPDGRKWWHDRLVLSRREPSKDKVDRRTKDEVDRRIGALPPMDVRTRQPDPETLTRNFGWAVRHLLAGEKQSAIARTANFSRPVIGKGIAKVLELLPPAEIANARLRRYVVAMRDAERGHGASGIS